MFKAPLITLVYIFFLIGLASCGPDGDRSKTIVLYGFSSMENVMKEEIIPSFQGHWKETTGEEVKVITSFAGSGTITNQIVFGAPAQIAMVATELDASNIKNAGMTKTDWASFKNQGTYAYTITLLVTRQGIIRTILGVHSFYDAAKPIMGVDVVHPDPTTSGGAQWAILALYGSTLRTNDASTESESTLAAVKLLTQISSNAGSLPESARRALTQFALGYGDALLTYENEALLDVAKGHEYEIIVPVSTILVEPKSQS